VNNFIPHFLYRFRKYFVVLILFAVTTIAFGQTGKQYATNSDPKFNRQRGLYLLEVIKAILKERYFDTKFQGMNLEERFKTAGDQIKKQDMNWQIYRSIAQLLSELNDSHTTFLPPDRLYRVEYGFTAQMIGVNCHVVTVTKGSDAEKKGLKAGDQVISVSNIGPTRRNFNTINYIIYGLDPQESIKLTVVGMDGKQRELEIIAKFLSPDERKKERKKRREAEEAKPFTCKEISTDLIACKLRTFDVEKKAVENLMKEVAGHNKLILDLRGNGGGLVETEHALASRFFAGDVTVGQTIRRNKAKDEIVKGAKEKAFTGDLAVLIDSESASASEVFARTIQIQKRGMVFGDTSMGAVMFSNEFAVDIPVDFLPNSMNSSGKWWTAFVSVTVEDVVMSDGGRLEGVGVSPDYPVGPSPLALLQRSDPVLAFAAEKLGSPITAEKAGEFYFMLPKTEEELDKGGDALPTGK